MLKDNFNDYLIFPIIGNNESEIITHTQYVKSD